MRFLAQNAVFSGSFPFPPPLNGKLFCRKSLAELTGSHMYNILRIVYVSIFYISDYIEYMINQSIYCLCVFCIMITHQIWLFHIFYFVSDRKGDDCVPVLLASQWIDRWGHLPVCPRRTSHPISKDFFLLSFGRFFPTWYSVLYYKGH